MIVENAPALLMFSFDQPLSKSDQEKLNNLNSTTKSLSQAEIEEKRQLESKQLVDESFGFIPWIPIPVNTKVTPFASKSYNTLATKK